MHGDSTRALAGVAGVSFDLDGTLIESTDAIVECFDLTFDRLGDPAPARATIVKTISRPLEDQFRALSDRDPDSCAAIYREFYREIGPAKTVLLPGAVECLTALREAGLKLGIATSKYRASAELLLDRLGVRHFFHSCIGPDDVRHPKPHPEPVLKSLEELGLRAGQAYFVGDTRFDVDAAGAACVRCIALTTGYATREELLNLGPETVLDSLPEVAAYILARV